LQITSGSSLPSIQTENDKGVDLWQDFAVGLD
jgi:hypothetical protein